MGSEWHPVAPTTVIRGKAPLLHQRQPCCRMERSIQRYDIEDNLWYYDLEMPFPAQPSPYFTSTYLIDIEVYILNHSITGTAFVNQEFIRQALKMH
jgi:hypothetical protein